MRTMYMHPTNCDKQFLYTYACISESTYGPNHLYTHTCATDCLPACLPACLNVHRNTLNIWVFLNE